MRLRQTSEGLTVTWLVILVVVIVAYLVLQSGKNGPTRSGGRSNPKESAEERVLRENDGWLRNHWADADRERAAGTQINFPHWYFDPVTEPQLNRIRKDGVSVSGMSLTKGKASDIIGLFVPIEESDAAILKFFKVSASGMNETKGRVEARKLLNDTKNAEAWKLRPAEPMQREYMRHYGLKIPKELTCNEATRLIKEHGDGIEDDKSPMQEEWDAFESIVDELSDKDVRQDYGIKKPSLPMIRAALEALHKEGKSYSELLNDVDLVIEKLIELTPELERVG